MKAATALWLVGLALIAGCAKYPHVLPVVVGPPPVRPDLYVLLPGADGKVGVLVVSSGGQQQTLDTALAAAKVGQPGAIEKTTTTDADVRAMFGGALAAQPPRPTAFTVNFELGTDDLTPESERAITDILNEIATRPAPEVLVIGHADAVGSNDFNDRLSLKRAESIRAQLIGRGIPPGDITASGRGTREPLVPTQGPEPKNRRVEIVVR